MAEYLYLWYVWMPLAIVGSIVLLAIPWLGVIALMFLVLAALAALALAIVWMPLRLFRAIRTIAS